MVVRLSVTTLKVVRKIEGKFLPLGEGLIQYCAGTDPMQNYKSLRAAVMICATVVNTHTVS